MTDITAAAHAPRERPHSSWLAISRSRAFSIHLSVSVVVLIAAAAAVLAWYPQPYFSAMRAWDAARIHLLTFIAAGPLLTLILFKPGKRGLAFDVVVVACLQLIALGYGLTLLYRDRPQFVVFAVDRFFVLTERDLPLEELPAARSAADNDSARPALVLATMPSDPLEQQRLLDETLFQGKPDIERRPELWRPFADAARQAIARQRPLAALRAAHPATAAELDALPESVGFLPLVVGDRHLSAIVDARTGVPIDVVDADPWVD